ncbi:uncharacterized protein LOC131647368 [Vicia villosa]|uniref:uncharacterized protein LOC131647368 n=1 Tax=Vicia villosa TaxID=3911 RepID=UPI00273C9467|nr:uncharacterized protein LOC131647368 [Vicia villosa]
MDGDKNTKFFHNSLKERNRRKAITSLEVSNGRLEGVDNIKEEVKRHFFELYKEEDRERPIPEGLVFNAIEEDDVSWLERRFSEEEIKEAVWSCDGNKSPDPDGFTLEFFKRNWEVLKEDVFLFVKDFYEKAKLTKACTSSFVTLVPKVNNPQTLNEFRPICLVGSFYKILAKLLANRLKRVIGKLVSNNQSAFIGGKNIADGVLVVNEVLDLAKRDKRSCVVLKVDFEKAYDRVSWNFVRYIFKRMGFGVRWMRWMECCIFTNSLSVLVNGSATKDFRVEKGLRQVLAEGDTANLWSLKAILRGFEMMSGLRINFHKSNLYGINVGAWYLEAASSFLSCKVGSLPFKFPGVRVGESPRRVDSNKTIHWVGWDMVCKSRKEGGLGVKNVEIMNVALLSKWKWRILTDKEAVWQDLLKARYGNPKLKVLIGDISILNKKDSHWWRDLIMSDNYERLLFDHLTSAIKYKIGVFVEGVWHWIFSSWFGEGSVAANAAEAIQYFGWQHHGTVPAANTSVAAEAFHSFGRQHRGSASVAADNATAGPNSRTGAVLASGQQLADILQQLLEALGRVPVREHCEDSFSWALTTNGCFSVKFFYDLFMASLSDPPLDSKKVLALIYLWKCKVPSKNLVFGWRFIHNRIATGDQLVRRGILAEGMDSLCALCL